jgi:hypothetical protein
MATFTIDLLTGTQYLFSGDFNGSGGTSGSTSWTAITNKPQWLSGTTLSAFQLGHTHGQYATIVNTVTGATNLGTGTTIFTSVVNNNIQLKSLKVAGMLSISNDGNHIILSGGTGGINVSSERITKLICQTSHGFSGSTVIGWSGGTYNKAIANGTYDGEVLGIVSKCYNSNCFDLTQAGYVTGLTGLVTNTTYFLSDVTPGLLTSTEPTIAGHISKTVLIATSGTTGWVLPYIGYIITTGGTGSGGTGSTSWTAITNKPQWLSGTTLNVFETGHTHRYNSINQQTGITYTLSLTDVGNLIVLTNAAPIAVTIPTEALVPFLMGITIDLIQGGAGKVTFSGAGVTIKSKASNKSIGAQNVAVSLIKESTDTWYLIGDLIA